MEYFIVKAPSEKRMVERVNAMLALGFKPQGGITIGKKSFGNIQFYQAVVKEKKSE